MTIDQARIGFSLPSFTVVIDAARVQLFSRAIGETAPQGADALAPPTFLKAIDGEHNSSRVILETLQVDLKRVLHVQQEFEYGEPVRVGDHITVRRSVIDIYAKRAGALEFIVIESVLSNAAGQLAGRARQLVMVRNPQAGSEK